MMLTTGTGRAPCQATGACIRETSARLARLGIDGPSSARTAVGASWRRLLRDYAGRRATFLLGIASSVCDEMSRCCITMSAGMCVSQSFREKS
jgi:hypothetical protein